jgi:ribosomal protein S17E
METRSELKNAICQYLTDQCKILENGVFRPIDKSELSKILIKIKDCAFTDYPLDNEDMRDKTIRDYAKKLGLKVGDGFYRKISWSFDHSKYNDIAGFVKRYEAILEREAEEEQALEAKISEAIDPYYGDEYAAIYDELGAPSIAILIHPDHIEVRAYEKGWGDRLPKKGRKYVGNVDQIAWTYPLSALGSLPKGHPIVKIEDLKNEN